MTIGPKINPWAAAFASGLSGLSNTFAGLAQKRLQDEALQRKYFLEDRNYGLAAEDNALAQKRYELQAKSEADQAEMARQHFGLDKMQFDAANLQREFGNTRILVNDANPGQLLPDALVQSAHKFGMPLNFTIEDPKQTMSNLPGLGPMPGLTLSRTGESRSETPQEAYMRMQSNVMQRGADRADSLAKERDAALTRIQQGTATAADWARISETDPIQQHKFRMEEEAAREKANQNYVSSFVGYDNGVPVFRRVPDLPGQEIKQQPAAPNMTGKTADDLAALNALKKANAAILSLGDAANWKGVGGGVGPFTTGSISDWLYRNAGIGSAQEAALRSGIEGVFSAFGNVRSGQALTKPELEILEKFVARSDQHPNAIKTNAQEMDAFLTRKIQSIMEANQLRQRPGGNYSPDPNLNIDINSIDIGELLKHLPSRGKK